MGGNTVSVRVRYLSAVRERAGTRQDEVGLPAGSTLADVASWIGTNRSIAVPAPTLMATMNGRGWTQLPAGMATEMHDGDEVALFPLLSGG